MRVHKNFEIHRRELEISNWKEHKFELIEDFHGICGYCGKHFVATLCVSQIDHFRPRSVYPEYENKYSNLVLSCKVCNNKKKKDWPSADPMKNITDDAKKGYIDPASDEFDVHLERNEDGSIVGKTEVGKYIVKRLGFECRPIRECFKIWTLFEEYEKLKLRIENSENDINYEMEIALLIELNKLRELIYMGRE